MLQNDPECSSLRKSVPGPPNISDERVSCTAPATENASLTILFKWPTPATFDEVHNPLRRPRKTTSERPTVLRTCQLFTLLILKCASRHNGVHFFDISTSKSAPTLLCFVHFDLDMRFAPQQRALFRHHNFQKCSDPAVFCTFWLGHELCATTPCTFRHHNFQKYSKPGVYTFWLGNVLGATTVCNFSSLFWPHGSAPAALVSRLFDPPEPQIIGKNTGFGGFATFSRTCIFFLLSLSLLWPSLFCSSLLWLFPPLLFHLSILSEVWLLNFFWWNISSIRIFKSILLSKLESVCWNGRAGQAKPSRRSYIVHLLLTGHRHEFSLRPESELSGSACGAASSATAALQCGRRWESWCSYSRWAGNFVRFNHQL